MSSFNQFTQNEWLNIAVTNNIDWYCAEAQSWELPYTRASHCWHSSEVMPPYHSNLISCNELNLPLINQINQAGRSGWSIKDAHNNLDLAPHGFEKLFDALWYACPPSSWQPTHMSSTSHSSVQAVHQLETQTKWVEAWDETPVGRPIFQPQLLNDPRVEMIYLAQDDTMVAGLCSNQSEFSVGITNTFGSSEHLDICYSYIANKHPQLAIVGYDDSQEVSRLGESGAIALGELRIWIQQGSTS